MTERPYKIIYGNRNCCALSVLHANGDIETQKHGREQLVRLVPDDV